MSISMEELLKGKNLVDLPKEHQENLAILLEKMNKIRDLWGKPMTVTSGYRSKEDHLRIYKELAVKRNKPFDEKAIPWGSAHLKAAAVDIADNSEYTLYNWCQSNIKTLEDVGLWCEVKDDQKRVHFQIYPPKSGHRFFDP